MRSLFLIAIMAVPSYAISAALVLGGWSHHKSKGYRVNGHAIPYNNKNNLIALDVNNYIFASFKNSYYEQTKAIGYEFKINKYFGVMPLLTDTYDDIAPLKIGPVNLMGMLTFKAGPVVLLFVPNEVYTLAIKFKL